jgi:hypothetical protein
VNQHMPEVGCRTFLDVTNLKTTEAQAIYTTEFFYYVVLKVVLKSPQLY